MKYRRSGFEEARAEASKIAEAFVVAGLTEGSRWGYELGEPEPDQDAPGFDRRKPVSAWIVWVKYKPLNGGGFDGGDGWLLVDLESKRTRWKE